MYRPLFRTKICGIRNEEDYRTVVRYCPDAIGFIVGARHFTEDEVDTDFVREIMNDLKKRDIATVGVLVTHLLKADEVAELASETDIRIVQIHDDMPVEELARLRLMMPDLTIIKAVHVNASGCVSKILQYSPYVDAICLDTVYGNRIGGTGKLHNWDKSKILVRAFPNVRFILAGGLTPDNVADAIKKVRPYAVDVNTGVEIDGNKDETKVRLFLKQAREHFREGDQEDVCPDYDHRGYSGI